MIATVLFLRRNLRCQCLPIAYFILTVHFYVLIEIKNSIMYQENSYHFKL